MFVRNVSIQLKPNTSTEFAKIFDAEILPLLRKQSGFQNELTYGGGDSSYLNAISLWDSKQSADTYEKNAYPQVMKLVEKFLDGTPKVRSGEVLSSTLKTVADTVAA